MRRLLLALVVVVVLVAAVAAVQFWRINQWLNAPLATLERPVTVEIARGTALRTVAADLAARGLIEQPRVWTSWARATGRANSLKAGEYELQPGLTPRTLLELLNSGQVVLHGITFIEGETFADMRRTLAANTAIRGDFAQRSDSDIMRALGEPDVHPEG